MPLIPRSLSASALEVARACPARWKAENHDQNRTDSGAPALLGLVVHGALEQYIGHVYIDKSVPPDLSFLLMFYGTAYDDLFDSREEWHGQGKDMLVRWHARTSFEGVRVISVENKSSFAVKLPDGSMVPFNYIIDRLDELERDGKRVLRVVDYKSIRRPISPEELRRKLQARAYGLAMAIEHKDSGYDEVWVEFDLLRHSPVGMVLTREDHKATWKMINRAVRELYNQDEEAPEEHLNPGCHYCVRKAQCKTLHSNAVAGGLHSFQTLEEMVEASGYATIQAKALNALLEELDGVLLATMDERDVLQINGPGQLVAHAEVSKRRTCDPRMLERILPADVARRYSNFRLGDVDAILADPTISEDVKKRVRGLIGTKFSDPRIEVKGFTDEEDLV